MLKHMPIDPSSVPHRVVHLFRNGRSQAVRIPREFELPGNTVTMRREGSRLIIEPEEKRDLLELLAEFAAEGPIDEEFPDIPDLPAEPVEL